MQLVAICMQPMTLIRKTWEKIATEILSLNVITPAFEKLRWKSNLGKPRALSSFRRCCHSDRLAIGGNWRLNVLTRQSGKFWV